VWHFSEPFVEISVHRQTFRLSEPDVARVDQQVGGRNLKLAMQFVGVADADDSNGARLPSVVLFNAESNDNYPLEGLESFPLAGDVAWAGRGTSSVQKNPALRTLAHRSGISATKRRRR